MLAPMNDIALPFDEAAAEAARSHAAQIDDLEMVPLALTVQPVEGAKMEALLDECWMEIEREADAVESAVSQFDVFMDKARGVIHMRAGRALVMALTQRSDFFSRVALDEARYR